MVKLKILKFIWKCDVTDAIHNEKDYNYQIILYISDWNDVHRYITISSEKKNTFYHCPFIETNMYIYLFTSKCKER